MSSGGGLIQLINASNTDEYLTINNKYDQIFEDNIKTNKMGKTTKRIDFERAPVLYSENNGRNLFISNNLNDNSEDLLTNVCFCCELPEIYSDSNLKFKWVKNIGLSMIKEISLTINDNPIQTLTSDWLNISYNLSIDNDKFDNIIGNTANLNNPSVFNNKKIVINNNKFQFKYYPTSSQDKNIHSIAKTILNIPLNFWFTKELKTALPMALLLTDIVRISLILEDAENLYTLYSEKLDQDISPLLYNELFNTTYKINDFLKNELRNNDINLNVYIQKTGYLLGAEELNYLVSLGSKDYIIDDVVTIEKSLLLNTNLQSVDLGTISKPIKEIIWVLRREDSKRNFNNHTNFTGAYNTNSAYNILNNATYKVANQYNIFEELNSIFLSYITPFNTHEKIPDISNIYLYSFARHPESKDSTGHFNATNVNNKLNFKLNTFDMNDEKYNFNLKLHKLQNFQDINKSLTEYKVKIFIVCYNFVNISRISGAHLILI